MEDVTLVTMSEFGRTVARKRRSRNRSRPRQCDVRDGRRCARRQGVWRLAGPADDEQLYEGRDLDLTTDFRDVLGELVARHLGNSNLKAVFPGYENPKFRGLIAVT